jgi:general secretion pathway protein J
MATRMSTTTRPRGFTLVELLIAISILAVVAVLGWRGLDSIVRARASLTEQMEVTRGMQLAFAQMQSDCEHKAGRDVVNNRPWLQVDANRFTLVREVFVENQPSRVQVVSYRIANGMLTRRESVPTRDLLQLDALWQAALSDADTSPTVTLQAGVTGMQIAVWQNNVWHQAGADPAANAGSAATTAAAAAAAMQGPLTAPLTAINQVQQRQTAEPTGMRVALQVQNLATPLVKSFLLGEP